MYEGPCLYIATPALEETGICRWWESHLPKATSLQMCCAHEEVLNEQNVRFVEVCIWEHLESISLLLLVATFHS